MKNFVPNEEEFETLLAALVSHEKTLHAEALVINAFRVIPAQTDDAAAFEKAFAQKVDYKAIREQCKKHRDTLTLLGAKLIQFRDFVRQHTLSRAVDELVK